MRGVVVGWYLPVLVVDEKKMKRVGGIRVVVLMKKGRRLQLAEQLGGLNRQ